MQIIDLNDLKSLQLNVLAYGEPGVGKTRFVGSIGECLYTLAVDVDNGFKTLKQLPQKWINNLVTVRMTGFEDVDAIYQMLFKNDPENSSKILGVKLEKPFEAVAIDTWSSLNWKTVQQKRKDLGKYGKGLRFRENIQIQDWGNIIDFNQLAIEAFTDLPITFVCTMHEMFFTDEKAGTTKGVPSINGKIAPEIGKYFDVQGHMYADVMGKYLMATKAHQRYQAKSRLKLDASIQDPTFKKLYDALKGQ
jgi:hypothetical protein